MFAGDRQLVIAVIQETAAQEPGVDPKIGAAETVLDRDLPQAGRTEDRRVLRIIEQRARWPTTGRAVLPPTAAGVCPAAASSAAAKEFLDLGITHPVEIVGYGDLSRQEPQAPDLPGRRRLQRGDLHQRSARLGE